MIAAAIEQPEYDGLSFGVISLIGGEQAKRVEDLLFRHLPPIENEGRLIRCGNAANFQGDERDVMFLSVVDGPAEGKLPLKQQDSFKKRLSVAVNRARNQLWVVHSVQPADDLKADDLRRR